MKNNLHISESSVADTQLEDKGLNNDLYTYIIKAAFFSYWGKYSRFLYVSIQEAKRTE